MSHQARFLRQLRQRVPDHSSLEQEMVKVLGIALEDAFALCRGLRPLAYEEAAQLADFFKIALGGSSEADEDPALVPFRFRAIDYNLRTLEDYFRAVLSELRQLDVFGPRRLIYAANDFPVFSLFQFPELAAFKLFFWGKTVYKLPGFRQRRFTLDEIDTANLQLGEQAWRQYLKMPSVEIWSSDIVSNSLKQVFHAWKFGFFSYKEDALIVLDKMHALLDHIERQAELGRKFHPSHYPPKRENYQLFYNEVAISNNTILFSAEGTNVAFVLQNTLNYLVTDHVAFCLKTEAWLQQLMDDSTPISIHNAELRQAFFARLHDNVEYVHREIRQSSP